MQIVAKQGLSPEISQAALVKKYWGWVFACSQISANAVASTPLRLYATRGPGQKGIKVKHVEVSKERKNWLKSRTNAGMSIKLAEEVVEVVDHPILYLLDSVNENANRFSNIELTDICEELTGNAYWFVPKNKLGVPEQIYVLRPQWTRIVPGKKRLVDGFIYGTSRDTEILIPREEGVHFKRPNPHDAFYGMGVVQAGAYAVERQTKMDQYEMATLANMGRPDFVIKFNKGRLTDEARNDAEADFNNKFQGAKNSGKAKILDEDWDIKNIGWSPREMQYITGRTWTMKEICSVFPVPVGMIDTEQISKAPRAGMEGSDIFLAKNNTLPRCRRMEQTLNEQLIPMYPEAAGRLFFAFDNPVPSDNLFQLQETTSLLTAFVLTINEVRMDRGLDPVEWGDTPFIPMGVTQLSDEEEPEPQQVIEPEPDDDPEPKPDEDEEDEDDEKTIDGAKIHPDLKDVEVLTQ